MGDTVGQYIAVVLGTGSNGMNGVGGWVDGSWGGGNAKDV